MGMMAPEIEVKEVNEVKEAKECVSRGGPDAMTLFCSFTSFTS
jgi:hypothetical protein